MQVSAAASAASDCAGSGRRSRWYRPTSSSAKCCASTELPPLPNVYRRPSRSYVSISRRATSSAMRAEAPRARPAAGRGGRRARSSERHSCATTLPAARSCTIAAAPTTPTWSPSADCTISAAAAAGRHRVGTARVRAPGRAAARPTRVTPAAEHDELGLEQVHDRGEAAGERVDRLGPDRLRELVARACGAARRRRRSAPASRASVELPSAREPPRRRAPRSTCRRRTPRDSRAARSPGSGRPCQSTVTWPSSPPLPEAPR